MKIEFEEWELKILLVALNRLVDSQQDTVNYTEIYNKLTKGIDDEN